jgi:hypothetical protein
MSSSQLPRRIVKVRMSVGQQSICLFLFVVVALFVLVFGMASDLTD